MKGNENTARRSHPNLPPYGKGLTVSREVSPIQANPHFKDFVPLGIQHIEDVTEEAWDVSVDLNLKAAFLACRTIVPHMRTHGYGRIVNISSSSAKGSFGSLGTSAIRLPYAAAKSGILGFTHQLAKDVAPDGIYVNAVMPGAILTEQGARVHSRFEGLSREAQDSMVRTIPLGRLGRADEVAKAVSFLASDDASYITGAVLEVTGGR